MQQAESIRIRGHAIDLFLYRFRHVINQPFVNPPSNQSQLRERGAELLNAFRT